MPLNPSPSKAAFKENVADMINAGHEKSQALAASYRNAREHGAKFAFGGAPLGQMPNGFQRPQGLMPQGFGQGFNPGSFGQGFGRSSGQGFGMYHPMMPQTQMPQQQMPQAVPMGGFDSPLMPSATQQMPSQGLAASPPPSAMNQLAVNPGTMAAPFQSPLSPSPSGGFAPPGSDSTFAPAQSAPPQAASSAPAQAQTSYPSFAPPHLARGGMPLPGAPVGKSPAPKGLIASPVAGRTDRIEMDVRPNSYIIPADVVSGIGQGNTLAGARIFEALLGVTPGGQAAPSPSPQMPAKGLAAGGPPDDDSTGIIAAGGEMVVPPEVVLAKGNGDYKRGHQLLDNMVVKVRKQIIDQLRKLPGPKKD